MIHKLATRFFIKRPVQGHGVRPYVERAMFGSAEAGGRLRFPVGAAFALWLLVIWFATGEYAPW